MSQLLLFAFFNHLTIERLKADEVQSVAKQHSFDLLVIRART